MKQLDATIEHFSACGRLTLKRLEREVSIAEQKYLELLHSLTLALLKQKSLQISSASLKVVTEPMFPITNEPTKRKLICLLAFLASFMLVAMYFIVQEWLDRTLRDDYRAEQLTGETVIGVMADIPKNAFTGSGIKSIEYDCSRSYLTRAILKSANPDGKTIINTFSVNSKEGKTFIWSPIVQELEKRDFKLFIYSTALTLTIREKLIQMRIHRKICRLKREKPIMIYVLSNMRQWRIVRYRYHIIY